MLMARRSPYVRLTPLVGGGILAAPLGGDPPEMAARVLALSVVAHRVLWVSNGGKLNFKIAALILYFRGAADERGDELCT